MRSKWKEQYRRFRQQEQAGLAPPLTSKDINYDIERANPPCEDVYHAAMYLAYSRQRRLNFSRSNDPGNQRFFRGQTQAWRVVPSLYRNNGRPSEAEAKLRRLGFVVHYLRNQLPGRQLTEKQAVAIAQHYAKEARVNTWLIDVSWDPFIALFFASDNGKDGEVGQVWRMREKDWSELAVNGFGDMGKLDPIQVHGVPRIDAQQAVFLAAPHWSLFEQYVPWVVEFHQHTGLVFEDKTLNPPVCRATIYPDDDSIKQIISRVPDGTGEPPAVSPKGSMLGLLSADDYLKNTERWGDNLKLSPEQRRYLIAICDWHAQLQQHGDEIPVYQRSLRQLSAVTLSLRVNFSSIRNPSLRGILTGHYCDMYERRTPVAERLLQEVANEHQIKLGENSSTK